MKLEKNNTKNIEYIKKNNGNSSDISERNLKINNTNISYIFLESVSSDDKISDFTLKSITKDIKRKKIINFENIFEMLKNTLPNSKVKIIDTYEDVFFHLSSGFTCIFIDKYDKALAIETKQQLDRGVQNATTEAVIKGPKDSFTENHMINIGLIRKRIKDNNLFFKEFFIGRRTKTKVTVSYIDDVVKKNQVEKVIEKLNKIDIDGILDSGYLRSFFNEEETVFPKIISTERPDLASSSLLDGKIIILVENSPFALIMPGTMNDFLKSPEDYYQKPFNVSFTRILRYIAFFITVLTPALYIAFTTFNPELIPDAILISLATERENVPFPTMLEVVLFLTVFEILRETDIRTPNVMGTAISVVGALVLGEASVNAGIISPIVVIVVAITSISGLCFYDIDFINAIRWYRLIFILFASFLGVVGFAIGLILFFIKLTSIECMGVPYLEPFSPFSKKGHKDSVIKVSTPNLKDRDPYLSDNSKRISDINEKNNSN